MFIPSWWLRIEKARNLSSWQACFRFTRYQTPLGELQIYLLLVFPPHSFSTSNKLYQFLFWWKWWTKWKQVLSIWKLESHWIGLQCNVASLGSMPGFSQGVLKSPVLWFLASEQALLCDIDHICLVLNLSPCLLVTFLEPRLLGNQHWATLFVPCTSCFHPHVSCWAS